MTSKSSTLLLTMFWNQNLKYEVRRIQQKAYSLFVPTLQYRKCVITCIYEVILCFPTISVVQAFKLQEYHCLYSSN